MAGMRAVIVSRGAPGTTAQECRRVSPAFLADCNEVLSQRTPSAWAACVFLCHTVSVPTTLS